MRPSFPMKSSSLTARLALYVVLSRMVANWGRKRSRRLNHAPAILNARLDGLSLLSNVERHRDMYDPAEA